MANWPGRVRKPIYQPWKGLEARFVAQGAQTNVIKNPAWRKGIEQQRHIEPGCAWQGLRRMNIVSPTAVFDPRITQEIPERRRV